VTERMVQPHSQ